MLILVSTDFSADSSSLHSLLFLSLLKSCGLLHFLIMTHLKPRNIDSIVRG